MPAPPRGVRTRAPAPDRLPPDRPSPPSHFRLRRTYSRTAVTPKQKGRRPEGSPAFCFTPPVCSGRKPNRPGLTPPTPGALAVVLLALKTAAGVLRYLLHLLHRAAGGILSLVHQRVAGL